MEWHIGEAAGALAAYGLRTGVPPRHVQASTKHLGDLQHLSKSVLGIPLAWPNPPATIR